MNPDFISKRITELRMKKGIAEHRMSLELGHSRSYMQGISSRRALPSMTEFIAICDYLGVTPKEFFEEDNPNPSAVSELCAAARQLSDEDLSLLTLLAKRMMKP